MGGLVGVSDIVSEVVVGVVAPPNSSLRHDGDAKVGLGVGADVGWVDSG